MNFIRKQYLCSMECPKTDKQTIFVFLKMDFETFSRTVAHPKPARVLPLKNKKLKLCSRIILDGPAPK